MHPAVAEVAIASRITRRDRIFEGPRLVAMVKVEGLGVVARIGGLELGLRTFAQPFGHKIDDSAEDVAIAGIADALDYLDAVGAGQGDHRPIDEIAAGHAGGVEGAAVAQDLDAPGAQAADLDRIVVGRGADLLDALNVDAGLALQGRIQGDAHGHGEELCFNHGHVRDVLVPGRFDDIDDDGIELEELGFFGFFLRLGRSVFFGLFILGFLIDGLLLGGCLGSRILGTENRLQRSGATHNHNRHKNGPVSFPVHARLLACHIIHDSCYRIGQKKITPGPSRRCSC